MADDDSELYDDEDAKRVTGLKKMIVISGNDEEIREFVALMLALEAWDELDDEKATKH